MDIRIEEIETEEQFRKATKSLYPYVAKVYGWKTRATKKKSVTR